MYGGRTAWEKPSAGPAGNAQPGGPGRAPRWSSRRPRPEYAGAGRGAALRRARHPRPPGRHPPAAPADLGRGRDGRARRDDRAHPGQGAGPLDRRVHRGGAAAHGGRHQHRAADAALRVPRPARHREDHGGPGAGQDLLRLRPAADARGRSRRTGPTWSASTSARPRSRPTSSSTPRSAGCCSSTRRTAWSTRATGRPTGSARRRCRRCSSGPRTTATTSSSSWPAYEKQMESFLASNPGLASRFATRLKFPSYSPNEMMSAGPGRDRAARGEARRGRAAGALPQVRGGGPPPDRRRPGQRPVRPEPDREGRPGPRRARDHQHARIPRSRTCSPSGRATWSRATPS